MVQGDSTYKRNQIPGKVKTITTIIIIIIIIIIIMIIIIIIIITKTQKTILLKNY